MSFSAEMKDFISAYNTGQKINASRTDQDYKDALTDAQKKKTERDNDPDTLELEDKQARAKLALTQAQIAHMGASTGLIGERRRQLAAGGAVGGSGLLPATMAPGGAVAAPLTNTMQTDPDVSAYADGGLVPDDDDEDDATPQQGAVATAPQAQDTDVSARRRSDGTGGGHLEGVISPQLVHDATRAGLEWGANAYGLTGTGAIRTPRQRAGALAFQQGHGALTDAEMQAAKKAVDPQGKLTDSQRNMAALGSVYQFWMNKGEPDRAQKVAFQMLQHYRVASERYAAIAAHAADAGNMDLATKAAVQSYANVPDGRDLQVFKDDDGNVNYSFTDDKGNTVVKGVATPQQLASSAMGMASGGFDKAILMAAGAREKADGKAPPVPKIAERDKLNEVAGAVVNKAKDDWVAKNPKATPDENYWGDAGDLTQHVMQNNPKATPREAFQSAQMLLTPDKSDPEKAPFTIELGGDDGVHTVKFNNGLRAKLSDEELDHVMNLRAARIKTATDKINKDMEDSDKPGVVDKAKVLIGAIKDAAAEPIPLQQGGGAIPSINPYVQETNRRGAVPVE
jgi:hypothetical protein